MKIKKILVSQPKPQSEKSPYYTIAQKHKVKVDFHQFIRLEPLSTKEFRAQHINILDYTAIIFNSKHGVDLFFALCQELKLTLPDSMHYYCVSETVGLYLQKYVEFRRRKVFYPSTNKLPDLVPLMKKREEKFVMVMSDVHVEKHINMFAEHDIKVTPAVVYRTVSNYLDKKVKFDYDMVVLFTPSGVHALLENFPQLRQSQGELAIACLGDEAAETIEKEGLRLDIKVPNKDFTTITAAIDAYIDENHKKAKRNAEHAE